MNERWKEELLDRSDIIDILSKYITLNKRGRDYWACCPFHHEDTPSFQVRADRQYYRCFGCQKSGNVITFLMEYEKLTYPETLEWLAKRAGMTLPERYTDPEAARKKAKRDAALNAARDAARFYHSALIQVADNPATAYLARRGFSEKTIKQFGLGYSPDFYSLPDFLKKKGHTLDAMLAAGLVEGAKQTDSFGGRLIVPIIDKSGNVIGFGGRILDDAKFAKYKNTAATDIFDKKNNLYNINNLKSLSQAEILEGAVLVEGYMDVISLAQAGVKGALAPMGTALTPEQARLLKRFVKKVYVCFDGDAAGQAATDRSLDILAEAGLEIFVASMPNKKDPDDIVREGGAEAFKKLLDEALPLIDFKLKRAEERNPLTSPDSKRKYLDDCAGILKALTPSEREVYGKIIEQKTGVSIDRLISAAPAPNPAPQAQAAPTPAVGANIKAARFVLYSILHAKDYVDISRVGAHLFTHTTHKAVFDYIKECIDGGRPPKVSILYEMEDRDEVGQILASEIPKSQQEKYYTESLSFLSRGDREKRYEKSLLEIQKRSNL
jgi:DNA primase